MAAEQPQSTSAASTAPTRSGSSSSASSASSATRTEPEEQHQRDVESLVAYDHSTYFSRLFDQAGMSRAVIEYQFPGKGTEENPFLVDFIPNDPKDPMALPNWKKWTWMMLHAMAVLAVTFVSSAYSGAFTSLVMEFHASTTVIILGVSLFVLGFALGPLIWAPMSEIYGRQWLFIGTMGALTAFNAGAAGATNIHTLIILRFFAGTIGSSPLTNSGGLIADAFTQAQRGLATSIFAAAPFLGPALGPIAGGFLSVDAGWRWVEGLMAAFTGVMWIIISLTVPETYAPVILQRRAEKLSAITGKKYISKLQAGKPVKTIGQTFKTALARPWVLLFREPIVLILSLFMAILYGTLYMLFAAFPIVYQQGRGWSPGVGGLAFLGVAVGMMVAVGYTIWDNRRYAKISDAHDGLAPPEARLPPALIGAVLLPVGMFWFAWTNGPEVHFMVSITGTAFFGAGLVLLFLSLMNYLIDTYVIFAASTLAANAVIRSLFGAAFPLFTGTMYTNLGIHWASSIPAFLGVACLPFPFLFYKYGKSIRLKCRYAAEAAEFLAQLRGAPVLVRIESQAEKPVM
ncbi:major facilitator superfamily transporter [Microdochium trichocladiopsis]|uniref:Major facilitator superfamily transporter n=1 Tax=Microdochium trichocladiopsis TaxID=1682393 RepID=A0A9P8YKS7_9PEZI|nr:major facilitator superfamily transporter [Microdochium trichocladiopsis]KAH7041326.1 major facilitator superfamily transporter [Microdochium trichocladiopsis]